MYRIRLTSGEEAVYRTVEELAQAVASGVVSPTAEVFHKAGSRWLPINTHPDYRALITAKRPAVPRQSAPHAAPTHSELPPADQPTPRVSPAIPLAASGPVKAIPLRASEPPPPEPVFLEPVPESEAQVEDTFAFSGASPRPATRPGSRRNLVAAALGATGFLLLAGLAVVYTRSAPRQPSTAVLPDEVEGMPPAPSSPARSADVLPPPAPPAERPAPVPDARLARPDTVAVAYPAPSKPLPPASPASGRPAPDPPRVVSRLGTTVTRMPSYYEAYADARAEMDESLDYVDFRRVFAPSRFGSPDSVRAARRMVVAAGNILRVYRGREVMLEQTYRPGEPEGKGSLREPFEVAEASRGLLADVDSLFAILLAQEGEVRYRDNALSFGNTRAARAYSDVRRRILQILAGQGDPAESADRVTMPRLLRAFGSDRPPPVR